MQPMHKDHKNSSLNGDLDILELPSLEMLTPQHHPFFQSWGLAPLGNSGGSRIFADCVVHTTSSYSFQGGKKGSLDLSPTKNITWVLFHFQTWCSG